MNWLILIPFGVIAIALLAFLIVRNKKDRERLENQLNQDYKKAKDEEADIEIE